MYLPIVGGMAKAGHHVIWANSRYRGADYALVMEKVAADLGATVTDARDRLGYEKVVLAGWSGGGSLSTWYQSLAESGEGLGDNRDMCRVGVGVCDLSDHREAIALPHQSGTGQANAGAVQTIAVQIGFR